eukprot:tig00001065_g6735.t1
MPPLVPTNGGQSDSIKQKKRMGDEDWGKPVSGECGGTFGVLLLMLCAPILVIYFFISHKAFDCSMIEPALQFSKIVDYVTEQYRIEQAAGWANMLRAFYIWAGWYAFQIFLWFAMPSPIAYGDTTPKGHKLPYRVNGLRCMLFSVALFSLCSFQLNLFSATIIYDHWGYMLVIANIFGYTLTVLAYIKSYVAPTNDDIKRSGNVPYDMLWGVELNPRFGNFDFKLFFNGRPGIAGWPLLNLSFAAKQYELHGVVTPSMILVNIFHFLYVLDFFIGEDWYLATLDIMLDHFGFYYAYGDNVFLPYAYTLQGFFLVTHPVELSPAVLAAIVSLNLFGLWLFRSVNNQKMHFRQSDGKQLIWGKKPTYITATYKKPDGTEVESKLLTSGWWGMARHVNYFGDLCMALAWCLPTGFTHIYGYAYFFILFSILMHRRHRDHLRCSSKYGKHWDKYCQVVPYKIIPYVW